MEVEMEARVKPLGFKVKAISRESSSQQKAVHLIDTDLRNHWSTGTNTKEWILLELDEPCLLSHIRIYNKSVLEWEIFAGLQYKPETFVKVRPRCEAPRRDMIYSTSYTPCRYVRLSCLRGNPIAIFFIQLFGISVPGLEPEFLPVVNYLLPDIIAHKQDGLGVHLQLLQDMTSRLMTFLPHLELDLNNFSEAPESTLRFLTMLIGPLYPIIQRVNERSTSNISYLEASKVGQPSAKVGQPSASLMVSSNFEPRRSRTSPSILPTSSYYVFRPDVVFTFLRRASKDSNLGKVCRMASRILLKFIEPAAEEEISTPNSVSKAVSSTSSADYMLLFGEDFRVTDDQWDLKFLNILDIALVEEGIFHILYACASQPLLCSKLADASSDFWSTLPLVHALLPALRPNVNILDNIDDNFSQWKQPYVQHALSQVVATSSSPVYRPLLRACSGYLSSFSPSHAKAASVLIDLCSGVLAPWIPQVVAKIDLTLELLEDLLGIIQATQHSLSRARAALKCIVLALSGHMDDLMPKFKSGKQQILFLVEMLEPFLDPAMTPVKSTIAFGNMSSTLLENQEHNCDIALNVIRTALNKSAVLPSIEAEWRRGSVAPSVLLAILEPHLQLPPDIDHRKFRVPESQSSSISLPLSSPQNGKHLLKAKGLDAVDGKAVVSDTTKVDVSDDSILLFAPSELCRMPLTYVGGSIDIKSLDVCCNVKTEGKNAGNHSNQSHIASGLGEVDTMESLNMKTDYAQLLNYRECELRASEFRRLATDLQSHSQITPEGQDATVEALLLAAECYVNPYFQLPFKCTGMVASERIAEEASKNYNLSDIRNVLHDSGKGLEIVSDLERKRDKTVLEILLEAAKLDKKYRELSLDGGASISYDGGNDQVTILSGHDILSADAITLVRQNQTLLCHFLVRHLQMEQHPMHDILIQSLLFYLNSATRLFCSPECIVDIILKSAEYLNGLLRSFYYQFKEGSLRLDQSKLLNVQRQWMLLKKLVISSSGDDERPTIFTSVRNGPRILNLLPPSAWLQKVPEFSSSTFPLVRFLGWMAVSRNAKEYLNERLFLASDLTQLTNLLAIFSDDLSHIENIIEQRDESSDAQGCGPKHDANTEKEIQFPDQHYVEQSLHAIYPDMGIMFPNLKKEFKTFGETILEAVGLQLRSIPSTNVPDMLCWFSDLCKWPFAQGRTDQVFSEDLSAHFKGFASKNAKAVILYILEAIITQHVEAVVPEIPRMVQVILSLCSSRYCDVSFLDSIFRLLKPVISYSLRKASAHENVAIDDSCHTFESLCFDELFLNIKDGDATQSSSIIGQHNRALTIFVLASVFPELSFKYKNEILKSSIPWAKFASIEPTIYFHDYLCAYQVLLDNCREYLIHNLKIHGVIPLTMSLEPNLNISVAADDKSSAKPWFLGDIYEFSSSTEVVKELQNNNGYISPMDEKTRHHLNAEETSTFCHWLDTLISQLNSTIEQCCSLHPKIFKTLARTIAECLVYLKYLSFTVVNETVNSSTGKECLNILDNEVSGSEIVATNFLDQIPDHLRFSLEGFAETILQLQENRCWEVASLMLSCLLEVSRWFFVGSVIGKICDAMKNFSCNAPNIYWRLRTDEWMSILFTTGLHSLDGSEVPFIGLFYALLGHPEPELQFIGLKHMINLLGQEDMDGGIADLSSELLNGLGSIDISLSVSKQILGSLVSETWDHVALLASASTSWQLRIYGMTALIKSIPFAERKKLQSFLASADSVLQWLAQHPQMAGEGQSAKFSLVLVANVCFYSSPEDIDLIPDDVWSSIETLGEPQNGKKLVSQQQKICGALCRLKNEGEVAKRNLEEVLRSSPSEQQCPDLGIMRESILQAVSHLSSTQSYFDFFSNDIDQKAMEIEEAETEMELLQQELAIQESSNEVKASANVNRLQQIKDEIRSLEKTKLREEIISQRQKKLGLRRARQKYLEETAMLEAELLNELDREKTSEMEKEFERQRLLELERVKTRELRHNLEIEKEKQIQRELQRELEQVESGLRAPRRDFSSSSNSRVRDRYRENGRVNEGNLRTSTSNNSQPEIISGNSSVGIMPKIVLSGGVRQFSGPPTILQPHDRSDECGSSYEENFDGSRDSGDTGSLGDPEMVSSLDGQSTGYGSGQRLGSRGNKSRPVVERREREGRREGKWERKH